MFFVKLEQIEKYFVGEIKYRTCYLALISILGLCANMACDDM
jgi:hypothetical protein